MFYFHGMARSAKSLGIPYLHGFWHRRVEAADEKSKGTDDHQHWVKDNTLLSGLGLGLQETFAYLYSARPAFDQFEQWVLERNGGEIEQCRLDRLNDALAGTVADRPMDASSAPVLTRDEMAFWNEYGYVILHDAAPQETCSAAVTAIYEFLGADPEDPATWYHKPIGHTIWVPLLRHPALVANRQSPRIRRAFAQIWGRDDLWVNTDQCGFNPPERHDWKFPGPHLHWDMSLALPLSFGTQAVLYLVDTDSDQGAFTCVPGFHGKLETWLNSLPSGADPRQQDLSALARSISGKAGDLVIWNQALPHGSSPNRSSRPRVVQYLNLRPCQWDFNPVWK